MPPAKATQFFNCQFAIVAQTLQSLHVRTSCSSWARKLECVVATACDGQQRAGVQISSGIAVQIRSATADLSPLQVRDRAGLMLSWESPWACPWYRW